MKTQIIANKDKQEPVFRTVRYTVLNLTKAEILEEFRTSEKLKLMIEQLTDTEMAEIAGQIRSYLIDDFYDLLRAIVVEKFR